LIRREIKAASTNASFGLKLNPLRNKARFSGQQTIAPGVSLGTRNPKPAAKNASFRLNLHPLRNKARLQKRLIRIESSSAAK
jgi:hypothetical protein